MIPEIEKLEGFDAFNPNDYLHGNYPLEPLYYNYPLFEYIQPIANQIHRRFIMPLGLGIQWLDEYSVGVDYFAFWYITNKIDTSFKEKYLQAEDLHKTLKMYNIDKDKFWYLILFIKHFIDGEIGKQWETSAHQEILEIIDHLKTINTIHPKPDDKITIEINGTKLKYKNPLTLKTIAYCLNNNLEQMGESIDDPKSIKFSNEIHNWNSEYDKLSPNKTLFDRSLECEYIEKITHKQYLLTKYMNMFLDNCKIVGKTYEVVNGKKCNISKSKELIISRVAYIINYTNIPNDTSFYNEYDDKDNLNRKLKDNIRGLNDKKLNLVGFNTNYPTLVEYPKY